MSAAAVGSPERGGGFTCEDEEMPVLFASQAAGTAEHCASTFRPTCRV